MKVQVNNKSSIIHNQELREAITEKRVLFFGGLPHLTLPSKIKSFFLDLFGPFQNIILDTGKIVRESTKRHQLHQGRGFIIYEDPSNIKNIQKADYYNFEGHLVKVRVALSKYQTKIKQKRIRDTCRRVYLHGFCKRTPYQIIKQTAESFGEVLEISYLQSDFVKKACCFIVFKTPFIALELDGMYVKLCQGVHGRFSQYYSPLINKSQEVGTIKMGSQTLGQKNRLFQKSSFPKQIYSQENSHPKGTSPQLSLGSQDDYGLSNNQIEYRFNYPTRIVYEPEYGYLKLK